MRRTSELTKLYSGATSHPLFAPLSQPPAITTETFGTIMVLAWAAENGASDLPDQDDVTRELLRHLGSLPPEAREVIHAETRAIGEPAIAEYSEYMAAAQDAGLIKRFNPTHIRCRVEAGRLEARDRLQEYRASHGALIDWFEQRMRVLRSS